MDWPLSKRIWCLTFKSDMRRNHISELKGKQAWEQLPALSLTIPRAQFALNCQIYLNSIPGGLKEWATGRPSKEEKSLLNKRSLQTSTFSDRNLSPSELKVNTLTRGCCLPGGFPIFTATFLLQPNPVWTGEPTRRSFVARVCLAWWKWSASCPQSASLWEPSD